MSMIGLVRATAMNASRAKRAMMSHYQTYYEERAKSLDSIIDKFKHQTTFDTMYKVLCNHIGVIT